MKHTVASFGHAVRGLGHAVATERNIRRFLLAHIVIILAGGLLHFTFVEWILLLIFGCGFLVVELLNTALERLADTFDDCEKTCRGGHYHPGIKMTKDVAAAASLLALLLDVVILCLVFGTQILLLTLPPQ